MAKISLLAILLFTGAASMAQKQSEKEVKILLCHKWKIDYAKVGDERFPLPPDFRNTFLDIKSNGTVVAGNIDKQKKGKWRYDHKAKSFIVTAETDPWKFELIKVSQTELVMKMTEEGITMTMFLKRLK